ncbi:MAG: tetratricopeptide repeat protein, partial [Burkholderiales bacterium]
PLAEAAGLFQAGRTVDAAVLLEPVCAGDPGNAQAWFLLGACRHALGALDSALSAFDRVVALDPANVQAAQAAVAVLCDAKRPAEALARCKGLLSRHPNDAQLHFNTGAVCEALGDLPGALQHYDRALALDPDFVGALQNRGIVLTRLGRAQEAVENNRKFASLRPRSVDAHYNLAESCLAARRYDEAASAARQALAIDAGHSLSRLDLGLALSAGGHLDEAREELRKAVSRNDPSVRKRMEQWAAESGAVDPIDAAFVLDPEDIYVIMGWEPLERCEWDRLGTFTDRCAALIRAARPGCLQSRALAFKLLHLPLPASLQKTVADRIAEGVTHFVSALPRPARRPRAHRQRLRIGYLSADFGKHPVGYLTRSIYALHDRERFEVFGYALTGDDGSDNYRAIASGCDHMIDTRSLSLEQFAERIAADSIDILVDLNGYTRGGRSHVLALRPAPIQAAYVGYPATLGGTLADYFIADGTAVPPHADVFFAEKVVRLPHSYVPASHRSFPAAAVPTRSEEGLPDRGIVFCSFHRHEKIDPAAFRSWMRMLDAVPEGVLWLQAGPGEANLRRTARDAGIDPERLIFAAHREHAEHLARQRLADLFLDTRCWNAHTTGSDALWAGVPVITCPGEHLVSRLGASLLHGIGLDELAVGSFDDYEALAIGLAAQPEKLRALKERLEQNRETCPLFDTARLVRNLERAYLEMWRMHESGGPPRAFSLEDAAPFAAPREMR